MSTTGPTSFRRLRRRLYTYAIASGTDLYYRFLYGRSLPRAADLERVIHRLERGRRGDVPIPPAEWEAQYRSGRWDLLHEVRELSRYSVLAGYVVFLQPQARVLDVGCGEGLLALRLGGAYRSYWGIDVSPTAIERARRHFGDERTLFIHADAERFSPPGRFDVIVFNESLYYFEEPLAVFDRYMQLLTDTGGIAVSMYHGSQRARALLKRLARDHVMLDRTLIRNDAWVWGCCLFRAAAAGAAARPPRAA